MVRLPIRFVEEMDQSMRSDSDRLSGSERTGATASSGERFQALRVCASSIFPYACQVLPAPRGSV